MLLGHDEEPQSKIKYSLRMGQQELKDNPLYLSVHLYKKSLPKQNP